MTETLPGRAANDDHVLSLQDHPDGAQGIETAVILTIHASIFARSSRSTGLIR
jgi:hypothetical protein